MAWQVDRPKWTTGRQTEWWAGIVLGKEFFTENLLVRVHFIIVMIR